MTNIIGAEVAKGSSKEVTLLEDGAYDAVWYGIVQLGVHEQEYRGEKRSPANLVKMLFSVPEHGRVFSKDMPAKVHEKSNFFKYLNSMKLLTSPDNKQLSNVFGTLESLTAALGSSVVLNIKHFSKDDGTKLNYIESTAVLDARLPQPELDQDKVIFTFDSPDLEVFKNVLTSYTRKKIMSATNAKDLPKEFHEFYIADQAAYEEKVKAKGSKKDII